jgi:hypothetical protein
MLSAIRRSSGRPYARRARSLYPRRALRTSRGVRTRQLHCRAAKCARVELNDVSTQSAYALYRTLRPPRQLVSVQSDTPARRCKPWYRKRRRRPCVPDSMDRKSCGNMDVLSQPIAKSAQREPKPLRPLPKSTRYSLKDVGVCRNRANPYA